MRKVKKKMMLKAFLLALVSLSLLPSYAQELGDIEAKIGWIQALGVTWIFILIIGGIMIFVGKYISTKNFEMGFSLARVGLIMIFGSIFAVEIVYLLPYLGKPVVEYQECKGWSFADFPSIPFALACVFTGYAPGGAEALTMVTFFIFGLLAPLGLLISLFYNFSDVVSDNKNMRLIISIFSGILSLRFLMATLFTELLSYGFAGMGLLLIDYLFFMWMNKIVMGLFKGAQIISEIEASLVEDDIARLTATINNLRQLQEETTDEEAKKRIEKRIQYLLKLLEKRKEEAVKYRAFQQKQ
jgi:ABC-type multidrug transport system fused ATPase/permease subunit